MEATALKRAAGLAFLGAGATSPNPVVGAVVLNASGDIIAEGFHGEKGTAHAEVVALSKLSRRDTYNSTVVVTLEPCHTTGRTGPCTSALLEAGVRRVIYGVNDPTPAGGGSQSLERNGVSVVSGSNADWSEAAQVVNRHWLFAVQHKVPFVTYKVAATLDGRVAAADGSSQWISGPESRLQAQRLRATHDAIMVGVGTVLKDDCRLTVRGVTEGNLHPLRVVVDTHGRTPARARVLQGPTPTWVAMGDEGWFRLPGSRRRRDVAQAAVCTGDPAAFSRRWPPVGV